MNPEIAKKCRVCAEDSNILISLDEKHKNIPLFTIVHIICSICVTQDGQLLPNKICVQCSQTITNAYDLRIKCLTADRWLKENATNPPTSSITNKRSGSSNLLVSTSPKRVKLTLSEAPSHSGNNSSSTIPLTSSSSSVRSNERLESQLIFDGLVKQEVPSEDEVPPVEAMIDLISDDEEVDEHEGEDVPFKIITTKFGNPKIYIDGFPFTQKHVTENNIQFNCSKIKKTKCNCIIKFSKNSNKVVKITGAHNHPAVKCEEDAGIALPSLKFK